MPSVLDGMVCASSDAFPSLLPVQPHRISSVRFQGALQTAVVLVALAPPATAGRQRHGRWNPADAPNGRHPWWFLDRGGQGREQRQQMAADWGVHGSSFVASRVDEETTMTR